MKSYYFFPKTKLTLHINPKTQGGIMTIFKQWGRKVLQAPNHNRVKWIFNKKYLANALLATKANNLNHHFKKLNGCQYGITPLHKS